MIPSFTRWSSAASEAWLQQNSLTPAQQKLMLDLSRQAQVKIRELTESVDNFDAAKKALKDLEKEKRERDI